MSESEPRDDIFRNWERSSWVRSKPLRDGGFSGAPFSRGVSPLASHPAIAGREPLMTRVLAYRLLAHLKFTTQLELQYVGPLCARLGQGEGPVALTEAMRHDALRIYCDEGGHALFVELLARRVEHEFGLSRVAVGAPAFTRVLAELGSVCAPTVAPSVLRLFFVAISETLVSALLRDIPRDPEVAEVVRSVVHDHAVDEALHSAYFHDYFPRLWGSLRARQREVMSPILPDLLWAFLAPDHGHERGALRALGFDDRAVERIVEESYAELDVAGAVRRAAQPTLRMFEAAGVFESTWVAEAFAERGLELKRRAA
jgi:hypothetical protein